MLTAEPLPPDFLPQFLGAPPGPVGGRLAFCVQNWRLITDDAFIISVVTHGFLITPSPDFPGVLREFTIYPGKVSAQLALEEQISSLLLKRAIVKVDDFVDLCLSPIFVVPKRSGGLRVILNLKKINCFLPPQHFRMETLSVVLPQLSKEDWAVTIDLQDAYLHVPIHHRSKHLLGFFLQGVCYQYQVLPFGLRDSPWVFSRLVATLVAFLRRKGIRIFFYLDDWLLVAKSRTLLESHLQIVLYVTQTLGFLVNVEKSSLTPTRLPSFLGAVLDIPNLLARPMEHRVVALQCLIQEFLALPAPPALLWQKLLGHQASFTDLIPLCRLFMRPFQLQFLKFCPQTMLPCCRIPLLPHLRALCLKWNSRSFLLQGKFFIPPPPQQVISTDASLHGWGACLGHHHLSGTWSVLEARAHINLLELRAVSLALRGFEDLISNQSVLIQSDNSTVVAFLNHQGGTHSVSLCNSTLELLLWCQEKGILLSAVLVPGRDNLVADFLSRGKFLPSEWMVKKSVFDLICLRFPCPEMDLFASVLTFQLPKYCSRVQDREAWAIDALSFPWEGLSLYAFPPFSLFPKVLQKVDLEGVDLLLLAPLWPRRPWFPRLLSLLAGTPRSLPRIPDVIVQPISLCPHVWPNNLHLTVWPISGNVAKRQGFLRGLPNLRPVPFEPQPGLLTFPDWLASTTGVPSRRQIRVQPL